MSDRVLLMAVDGLDWRRLHDGIARGFLPHFAEMLASGAHAEVEVAATVPGLPGSEHGMISPALWTTVATGQYYFQHGVFDFRNILESPAHPPLFESRHVQSPRIWDVLTAHQLTSVVVGYYVTHPAYPVKGFMVSDLFGEVESRDVMWPPEQLDRMAAQLEASDYASYLQRWSRVGRESSVQANEGGERDEAGLRFERDTLRQFTGLTDEEIEGVVSATSSDRFANLVRYRLVYPYFRDQRFHSMFRSLIGTSDWQFATVYYRIIDFVSHGFWERNHAFSDDYLRRYGSVVDRAYAWIDACLGEIRSKLTARDRLIVLSDHGFEGAASPPELTSCHDISLFTYAEHADPAVLIASGGPRRGRIAPVSLLDIAPSVLDFFGIAQADSLDGGVVPGLLDENAPRNLPVVPKYAYEMPSLAAQLTTSEERAILDRLAALGYLESKA